MLITLPTSGIRSIEWTQPDPMVFVARNRWNASRTVGDLGGIRAGWRAKVTLAMGDAARERLWSAFMAQLRGATGSFQLPASDGVQSGPATATWTVLGSGQTSNLLRRSAEFGTSPWGASGTASVTANTAVAPDGTTTVDTINTPASNDGVSQTTAQTVTPLAAYVFSVWLSGTAGQTCTLKMDTSTGVGSSATATVTLTGTLTRYSLVFAPTAGATGFLQAYITRVGAQTATAIKAWGAQAEIGSVATEYVPTISATVVSTSAFLVSSLPASSTQMTAGQKLTINDRLFTLTGNVITDALGRATVPIGPKLPALTASGNVAYVQSPYCLMQLTGTPFSYSVDPGGVHTLSGFECEEIVT